MWNVTNRFISTQVSCLSDLELLNHIICTSKQTIITQNHRRGIGTLGSYTAVTEHRAWTCVTAFISAAQQLRYFVKTVFVFWSNMDSFSATRKHCRYINQVQISQFTVHSHYTSRLVSDNLEGRYKTKTSVDISYYTCAVCGHVCT